MRTLPLVLLFLAVPLAEIYLLIHVGGIIGAGWTAVLVVATAVLGAVLVKAQGFATLDRIRAQLERREFPAMEVLEGVFLLVAGALLLTPGFLTDAVGFACLTPPLRHAVIRYALKRGLWQRPPPGPGEPAPPPGHRPPIEGEFTHLDR